MKILHVGNNICGIPGNIRDSFKKLGIYSEVISFDGEDLNHPSDFEYNYPLSSGRLKSCFLRIIKTYEKSKSFDVLQFVGNSLANGYDIPLWKLLGKKVIIHNHGSEIRDKTQPYFHKYADAIFVSTPDLLKFAKKSKWLPNSININNYIKPNTSNDIIITHSPSDKIKKGSQFIIDSMSDIIKEIPNIKFNLINGLSYNDALKNYSLSTIVIDQMKIGWYGMVSLECMAIGIPVVCYISEDLLKYLPYENPIWVTTEDTFKRDVKYLLNHKEIRDKQIIYGKKYISEVHNSINIAKKILESIS